MAFQRRRRRRLMDTGQQERQRNLGQLSHTRVTLLVVAFAAGLREVRRERAPVAGGRPAPCARSQHGGGH